MLNELSFRDYGRGLAKIDPESRCQKCNDAIADAFSDRCFNSKRKIQPHHWKAFRTHTWRRSYLYANCSLCTFCFFLLQTLRNDSRLACEPESSDDQLRLASFQETGVAYRRFNDATRISEYVYYWPALSVRKESAFNWIPAEHQVSLFPCLPPQTILRGYQEPATFVIRPLKPYIDFNLISHWLHVCQTRHRDDALSNKCAPGPWPQALADVLRFVDITSLRIVQNHSICEYAALSYVWGNSARFTLSNTTIERLQQPGALSEISGDIPRTFLDAISVCRELGIQYLWIDAICIKQDDRADVAAHVHSMDMVYNGAKLTIMNDAPSADSGIAGISYPRIIQTSIYKAGGIEVGIGTACPSFGEAVKASRWETRGWTLQEKVFSVRMLVFTAQQAYFHCFHGTYAEDCVMEPYDTPDASHDAHISERNDGSQSTALSSYSGDNVFWGPEAFKSMVANYVPRQLSFEEDTITAFEGILRRLGAHFHGHPLSFFSYVINWRNSLRSHPVRRSGFPSWSWSGWKAPHRLWIEFDRNPQRSPRKMIGSAIEWYRLDPVDGTSWIPVPRSKRAKLEQPLLYGLRNHPGGENFQQHQLPSLGESGPLGLPLTHVLRFYTSVSLVRLEKGLDDVPGWYDLVSPVTGSRISQSTVDTDWHDAHPGPAELIVIAHERDSDSQPERERVWLMLIERQGEVVFRVGVPRESVLLEDWRATQPEWKCINLA